MVQQVYRGASTEVESEFYNSDGTAFAVSSPVTITVSDFNGQLVVTESAVQDIDNPAKWTASFTIPDGAPISDVGEKYRLVWLAKNGNDTKSVVEYFNVKLESDPISTEVGRILLKGAKLRDSLALDDGAPTEILFRLIDENGVELIESSVVDTDPTRQIGDLYYFDFESDEAITLDSVSGFCPLFTEWTYKDSNNTPGFEVHPVFIVTPRLYMFIDALRRAIDRINNRDINPALQWTDIDLVHFILMGVQRINRTKPTFTSWTTETIPVQFYEFLNKAAAVEALRAQYLAEGMSAFDFQGQAVQLTVDRTQYIQTLMDTLNNQLENELPLAKKLNTYRSGPGAMNITIGTHTNFPVQNVRNTFLTVRNRLFTF